MGHSIMLHVYLTIIPQVRVGYEMVDSQRGASAELAIIISYPTRASGIIVLLKTPQKYSKLNFKKIKTPQKKSCVHLPYS